MVEGFGTDICWNQSPDRLGTVTGEENIKQSIINRLTTTYDEFNWIYQNYGCNYQPYLGMKNNKVALEFIKNSIKQSIEEDDRIENYTLDVVYTSNGKVNVVLNIEGTDLDFILGE